MPEFWQESGEMLTENDSSPFRNLLAKWNESLIKLLRL